MSRPGSRWLQMPIELCPQSDKFQDRTAFTVVEVITLTALIRGAYTHNWSPFWNTSIYGAYAGVMYNSTAKTLICGSLVSVRDGTSATGFGSQAISSRRSLTMARSCELESRLNTDHHYDRAFDGRWKRHRSSRRNVALSLREVRRIRHAGDGDRITRP